MAVATLAYFAADPQFSFFTTYLSDIGDSPGWPAVIFNAGTLIAALMRLLFLVLVVICLNHLGARKIFLYSALFIGVISTTGTIMMTAAPYSDAPAVHEAGIPMYFWGVVLLQAVVGAREWSLPKCPNSLAIASFAVAAVFLVFGGLLLMVQAGHLDRSVPVIWEWLAYASSVAWVVIHTVVLSSLRTLRLNKVHSH